MADEFKIIARIVTDDKQAKVQAKRTGDELAKSVSAGAKKTTFGDTIKNQLEKVKKGIEAVGVSGDRLTKIGDFFQGGAIAAFAAAAFAAGASLKKMWDNLTETTEEFYARNQKNIDALKNSAEATKKEVQATTDYIQRLKELNQQQILSNAEKVETAKLVDLISEKYKTLGIEIDDVTGKVKNLSDVQRKFNDEAYWSQQADLWKVQIRELFGFQKAKEQLIKKVIPEGIKSEDELRAEFFYAEPSGLHYTEFRKDIFQKLSEGEIQDRLAWQSLFAKDNEEKLIYELRNRKYKGNADVQALVNTFQERYNAWQKAKKEADEFKRFRMTEKQFTQKLSGNNQKIADDLAETAKMRDKGQQIRADMEYQEMYRRSSTEDKIYLKEGELVGTAFEIETLEKELRELQNKYNEENEKLNQPWLSKTEILEQQQKLLELSEKIQDKTKEEEEKETVRTTIELEIQALQDQYRKQQSEKVKTEVQKPELQAVQAYRIQTNELTRRGGFKTGYTDNMLIIQKQIARNTQLTVDYLAQIARVDNMVF